MRSAGRRNEDVGPGRAPRARAALRLLKEAKIQVEARPEWLLESLVDGGRQTRRMPIAPLPFRIGRLSGLDLVLPSQLVSSSHAEIYDGNAGLASPGAGETSLRLRDLHSTNGTFVNRKPVEDVALHEGDIIHFADFEFRVGRLERMGASDDGDARPETISVPHRVLPRRFVEGTREVREMLAEGLVTVVFQPIVRLPGGQVDAYEVLGRGTHPKLPEGPVELFKIAADIGKEAELSRLFRRQALEMVKHRHDVPTLFLNTHPAELEAPGLLESLAELRHLAPHVDLALEIHERALAQTDFIVWLRAKLSEINIGIAYDDFGAGQARLLELAEAPPHFLKFDRRFVSRIESAPPARRRLLASLVAAARELLVKTVAEGVETAAEAEVCSKVGFTHAQGYYFARPHPLEEIPVAPI
jgi:EAL domain-containing protein (putative c-di-GMP-specific phosphodiesterase class I)